MTTTPPAWLRARASGDPEPDLTSYVVTHRAIREDLDRLTARLAELAAGHAQVPPTGAHPTGQYGLALLAELRRHHRDEDAVLWPVIAATAGQVVDLTPLTDDHEALGPVIARAEGALTALGSAPETTAAAEAVRDLRGLLAEHLREEDDQVLPAMRRFVPAGAYRWCERRIRDRAAPETLRFALPWLVRFATLDELRRIDANTPRDDRLLRAAAQPAYAELERLAFGASAPTPPAQAPP